MSMDGIASLGHFYKIDKIPHFDNCPPEEDSTFLFRYSLFPVVGWVEPTEGSVAFLRLWRTNLRISGIIGECETQQLFYYNRQDTSILRILDIL